MKIENLRKGMESLGKGFASLNLFPASGTMRKTELKKIVSSGSAADRVALRNDAEALRKDWQAVGGDLREAMKFLNTEND